jgi:N-acetylated-alpha-linked acidic dipeptidase
MEKYGDPEFLYHAAGARLWGLIGMRLASADIVPLRYSTYARDLQVDLDNMRREVIRRARSQSESDAAAKPAFTADFTPVLSALDELRAAGEAADRAADAAIKSGDAAGLKRINDALTSVEAAFLDAKGLPNRPWFRHMLIGPGLTTGYAPWPFPALQEALEAKDSAMFAREVARVVAALKAGTARLQATGR